MEIFTIGFTQRSARDFFGALKHAGIKRLIDVRLHNSSQLAGFSKSDDLAYFLPGIVRGKTGLDVFADNILAREKFLDEALVDDHDWR